MHVKPDPFRDVLINIARDTCADVAVRPLQLNRVAIKLKADPAGHELYPLLFVCGVVAIRVTEMQRAQVKPHGRLQQLQHHGVRHRIHTSRKAKNKRVAVSNAAG